MASFLYGREDVIPSMFSNLLEKWRIGANRAPMFVYYLKRHIEVDSDQHGPAAKAILAAATADDPARGLQVLGAARQSIEARHCFGSGVGLLVIRTPSRQRQARRPAGEGRA